MANEPALTPLAFVVFQRGREGAADVGRAKHRIELGGAHEAADLRSNI